MAIDNSLAIASLESSPSSLPAVPPDLLPNTPSDSLTAVSPKSVPELPFFFASTSLRLYNLTSSSSNLPGVLKLSFLIRKLNKK